MSKASDFFSSGGGGLPINSVVPLHTRDKKHTSFDGSVWLRSGVVETSVGDYPHAFVGYEGADNPEGRWQRFTLDHLEVGSFGYAGGGITGPTDICWDGEFYYVISYSASEVYKFTSLGVYTDVFWKVKDETDTELPVNRCTGIDFYDGHLWVVDQAADKVLKMRVDGEYAGTFFTTTLGGQNIPSGIAVNADGIYIVGSGSDKIAKYNHSGVYIGAIADIAVNGQTVNPECIAATDDGTLLYVTEADGVVSRTYVYDIATKTFNGTNFDLTSVDNSMSGITIVGSEVFMTGSQHNYCYKVSLTGVYKAPIGDTVDQPRGFMYDAANEHYYIAGTRQGKIFRFSKDLVYDGFNFDIVRPDGLPSPKPRAIAQIGDKLWVLDAYLNDVDPQGLFRYTMGGLYDNFFVDTRPAMVKPRDMTTDGTYFYIMNLYGEVHLFDLDGLYTGKNFSAAEQGPFWGGIEYDEDTNTLWMLNLDDNSCYQHAIDGTYTGNHFSTQSPLPVSLIVTPSLGFEVVDVYGSGVTKLTPETGVGLLNATDDLSGVRNYVRIK